MLVVVAGALFRLYLLGERSLYVDEAASITFARLPWSAFWKAIWEYEGNMVLYYMLLRGWIHLGDGETVVRSLSVLFGVATIPVTYLLGLRLFGRKAGLLSAVLLAVHAFHILYSQEARSYSLLLFLLVFSTYYFVRSVDSPCHKAYWIAYVLFSALAVYSHVFALLVLIAQWLSLGFSKLRRIGVANIFFTVGSFALLVIPMAMFLLLKNRGQIEWIPRPTIRSLIDFSYLLTGNGGKPLLLAYAAFCIIALSQLGLSEEPKSPNLDEPWRVRLVALWLVFPIAFTFSVSFIKPLFFDRYLLMCVPALVLLAGQGMTKLDRLIALPRGFSSLPIVVMIGLSLWGLNRDHKGFSSEQPWEVDWRLVTRYVLARQQPGDAAFFYRASGSRAFTYYVRQEVVRQSVASSPVVVFPPDIGNTANFNREPGNEQTNLATQAYKRVWLVLYHYQGLQRRETAVAAIQAALREKFCLSEQRVFPGANSSVTVLLYVRALDTAESGANSEGNSEPANTYRSARR
jgi:4-amino-4-deoxy-L-arabinose transferase-like glycosyltransferase